MANMFEKVMDIAGRAADTAVRGTASIVAKGRDKVEAYTLQTKLSKAQKQLGALAYMLHKTGQENDPMVQHYIDEIDRLKAQLSFVEEADEPVVATVIHECPACGEEVLGDAMFCRSCGAQLP